MWVLAVRTPLLQPPDRLRQAGGQATLMGTLLSPISSGADLTPSSMWLLAQVSFESHVLPLWPGDTTGIICRLALAAQPSQKVYVMYYYQPGSS